MTVLRFDIEEIIKQTGVSESRIIEILTNLGFPTEKEDREIIVEITPDRPDMFFFEGINRAIKSYVEKKPKRYIFKHKEGVVNKGVKQRPYIASAYVEKVDINERELIYLMNAQEKIHETIGRKRKKVAIGIHDARDIVLPIEYKEVDTVSFMPLGENRIMDVKDILEKHEKGIKYRHLIRQPYPVVKDIKGIISLPPIINAERTRLTPGKEKNILIEVTGTHRESVEKVRDIIACSFVDLGGSIIILDDINNVGVETTKVKEITNEMEKIKIDHEFTDFLSKISGIKLKKEDILKLLQKMDYVIEKDNAIIQPYRIDLMHNIDIVEDILIAYGYNNILPETPKLYTEGLKYNQGKDICLIMVSMGFVEIKSHILIDKEYLSLFDMEPEINIREAAEEEFNSVRPSIIPSLIKSLEVSKTRKKPIKIWELDKIFKDGKETMALGFSIYGRGIDINNIRMYLQTLMKEMGIEFELRKSKYVFLDEEQQSEIFIKANRKSKVRNNKNEWKKVGIIGILHQDLYNKLFGGMGSSIGVCEIYDIMSLLG